MGGSFTFGDHTHYVEINRCYGRFGKKWIWFVSTISWRKSSLTHV